MNGGSYSALTRINDNGVTGDGSANFTFLFDDIRFERSSNTTQLKDLGVSFFLNPATTQLTLQSGTELQSVEVFNMNGQRVLNTDVLTNNTLSTADLVAGTYILRVVTAEGVGTSTFIKR